MKLLVFLISRIMTLQWLEGQIPSSYSLFKTKTKPKAKQKKKESKAEMKISPHELFALYLNKAL